MSLVTLALQIPSLEYTSYLDNNDSSVEQLELNIVSPTTSLY